MMKVSAAVLAALALVGSSDAFLGTAVPTTTTTTTSRTCLFAGPVTGGPDGSSRVPSQYGQVDIDNPWGGRTDVGPPERVPAYTNTQVGISGFNGPINGGLNGSSLLPDQYETVDIDNPWGGKNPVAQPRQSQPGYGGMSRDPTNRPTSRLSGSYGSPTPAAIPAGTPAKAQLTAATPPPALPVQEKEKAPAMAPEPPQATAASVPPPPEPQETLPPPTAPDAASSTATGPAVQKLPGPISYDYDKA